MPSGRTYEATYEVEVKVHADHGAAREQFNTAGDEQVNRIAQMDTYYDIPHRNFAEIDEALRLRRESRYESSEFADEETVAAYKEPLVDESLRTRREYETGIEDGGTMNAICEVVGFEPAMIVEKEHERFVLGGYTVSLDSMSGLGEFMEVEIEVESGVSDARDGASTVLQDPDLDPNDQTRVFYLGTLLGSSEE